MQTQYHFLDLFILHEDQNYLQYYYIRSFPIDSGLIQTDLYDPTRKNNTHKPLYN